MGFVRFNRPLPRRVTMVAAGAASLLLSACFFAPGKFTSELDVKRDHTFAFHYKGEIIMIPLKEEAGKTPKTFEPDACHDDETYDVRECTEEEIAAQKAEWQSEQSRDNQVAQALLGGMDPKDPEAVKELADKLRRRQGWNAVEYVGAGKFEVDYSASGRLDHDFVFPTFEGFPMANAFVQVIARKDGSVRINAPTFGPDNTGATAASLMPGMPSQQNGGPAELADGRFTIRTDGTILANNTEEGPASEGAQKILDWAVNPRIQAAPTALIQLDK